MTFGIYSNLSNKNAYIDKNVDSRFSSSVSKSIDSLRSMGPRVNAALSKFDNIIILENADSKIPEKFSATNKKLQACARDAFGFVSRKDKAIVLIQDNHARKDATIEGDIFSQGADTLSHEVGHLLDEELSSTDEFVSAYAHDLCVIEKAIKEGCETIHGRDLQEVLTYLKHYTEGADFSNGITEDDITREGLRENFAECFSTLVDSEASEINEIFADLFLNSISATKKLCDIIC